MLHYWWLIEGALAGFLVGVNLIRNFRHERYFHQWSIWLYRQVFSILQYFKQNSILHPPFYSQVQYLLKVGGPSESDLPSHLDYWGGNSHSLELGEWMNVFFICNSLSLSRLMINRTSTSIQVATPFFPPTDWSGLPGGLFHLPTNNSSRNSEIA